MKKKPWYAYALADDGRSATIRINGVIGSWDKGRTIEGLDYELKWAADSVNEIIIRITSFGGSLAEALAMYGALRRHPAKKVAIIEGVAASAGTIVAMAADEIRIYANASMMVHGVSLVDEDGKEVTDDEASRVLNASIVETYAARTGKTAEDLAAALATDTWMTAREAVAAGWADSVIEITAEAAADAVAASPLYALASALEIPSDVLARSAAEAAAHASAALSPTDLPPADPAADLAPAPVITPAPATNSAATTPASATLASQINALAVAQGLGDHVAAWLLDGEITTATAAAAAISEACEVRDLCAFANASDRAGQFIAARKSIADVRAELINARAAASAQRTDAHHGARSTTPTPASVPQNVSVDNIYAALNSNVR